MKQPSWITPLEIHNSNKIFVQTISIIISGGSSKGAYQIGFFKALEKYGISTKIQAISATSIGVINAYAFLCGKLELAEKLWQSINADGIWDFRKKIKEYNLLQNCFNNLINEKDCITQNFYITLSEMSTMTPQYFNLKGEITKNKISLLKASIAIPMLTAQPLKYNEKYYFDGGVTNNIPFEPITNKKQDIIIIVHFTPGYRIKQEFFDTDVEIIYIDMTQIRGFLKGHFNFQQDHINQMIQDGQRFTEQRLNEFFKKEKAPSQSISKNFYYYLSAGRLLSILNTILMFEKNKRILLIKSIKRIMKGL